MTAKTQALIVICGPTAAGKSSLAMAIAQRLNSVILSADSRQVYRGFNIGTAKPSLAEQQQVTHELIDICEPTETLTLGDYQQRTQRRVAQYQAQLACRCPLLVGGTGLYIKAIARGLKIPRVPPQPRLRSQLSQQGQRLNYALLKSVDFAATERIHPNDAVRTQRALEVFYATGQPISEQQGENPPNYPILQLGVDTLGDEVGESRVPKGSTSRATTAKTALGKDRLCSRIAHRTELMVEAGFVEEVQALVQRYGEDLPLLNTLGYAEVRQHLRGEIDLAEAKRRVVLHTRQFAKRQRTWFRSVPEIEWLDSDAEDLVEQAWARIGPFLASVECLNSSSQIQPLA